MPIPVAAVSKAHMVSDRSNNGIMDSNPITRKYYHHTPARWWQSLNIQIPNKLIGRREPDLDLTVHPTSLMPLRGYLKSNMISI